MWKALTVMAAIAVPNLALADTLRANYAGCVTERSLDEMITAAVANDLRQMNTLLDAQICFNVGGREFSMIDQGFMTSEVRVYAGSASVRLFVQTEATR